MHLTMYQDLNYERSVVMYASFHAVTIKIGRHLKLTIFQRFSVKLTV